MNSPTIRQTVSFPEHLAGHSADPGASAYLAFAERLVRDGLISDPWSGGGAPRFRREPKVLSWAELHELYSATERVAAVYQEAMVLCSEDPALLSDFYRLTEWQSWMARASLPLWHGIARADVFRTTDGSLQICELNADTPTGEPEAIVLGEISAQPGLVDPNRQLEARFRGMITAMAESLLPNFAPRTAAIIYPTDMPEDLAVIRLYRTWLEREGWKVVTGAPFNITSTPDGVPSVFGAPCSLVLRHYKTDWWGERLPVFRDSAPYPSREPLIGPLVTLLSAQVERKCIVINPFGSVVAQNKRTMALFWEQIARFSDSAQEAIRKYIPYTVRLETLDLPALRAARDEWVLKSDYGCEGDEVVVGRFATENEWRETLDTAIPERWIAQRRFDIALAPSGESTNYGVYVIGGVASGLYVREQCGPTDVFATSVPALIRTLEERR